MDICWRKTKTKKLKLSASHLLGHREWSCGHFPTARDSHRQTWLSVPPARLRSRTFGLIFYIYLFCYFDEYSVCLNNSLVFVPPACVLVLFGCFFIISFTVFVDEKINFLSRSPACILILMGYFSQRIHLCFFQHWSVQFSFDQINMLYVSCKFGLGRKLTKGVESLVMIRQL